MPEVFGHADIKDLRGRPRKPWRFSTSYSGLHLRFLRVLDFSHQDGMHDWYLPRIMVGAHVG